MSNLRPLIERDSVVRVRPLFSSCFLHPFLASTLLLLLLMMTSVALQVVAESSQKIPDDERTNLNSTKKIEFQKSNQVSSQSIELIDGDGERERDGSLNVSAAALSRRKRSIWDPCPSKAKLEPGNQTSSYVVFYEPKEFKNIQVNHDGQSWRQAIQQQTIAGQFNVSLPTLIYVHGYLQSAQVEWLAGVRKRFRAIAAELKGGRTPPFNLFFFDWSAYSQGRYSTAVGFAPHLGQKFGQFLEELAQVYQYDLTKVHIICHSLSTHFTGLASRYLQERGKQISQITALDPTGVCFQPCTQFGREFALRNTDAPLVVSSHYDIGKFGSRLLPGGLDIIVNGGSHQPTSNGRRGLRRLVGELLANSHVRSTNHEAQEIPANYDCFEMAYSCTSYIAFVEGECGWCGEQGEKCYYMDNLGEMRFLAEQKLQVRAKSYDLNTQMYLQTGPKEPFCLHHYQIVVNLKPETREASTNILRAGKFLLRFGTTFQVAPNHFWPATTTTTPSNTTLNSAPNSPGSAQTNIRFTALGLVSGNKLVSQNAQLEVKASQAEAAELLGSLQSIELNYMSHPIAEQRRQSSIKLCWNSNLKSLEVC